MSLIKYILIGLLLCGQQALAANALLVAPVQVAMRNHGYTLGDTIDMHVSFTLKQGQVLDINTIPLKGPVNNWLDLRDVHQSVTLNKLGQQQIELFFCWQIFATVERTQLLKIPAIALLTRSEKPATIPIPAQTFFYSSVLPETLTNLQARPSRPPERFDTQTPSMWASLFGLIALLSGVAWLWLEDKLPWWPRNPGPITQVVRRLQASTVSKKPMLQLSELRLMHAALASSAGQTLYPNTLPALFHQCAYLERFKPEITTFFEQSWGVFFNATGESEVPLLIADLPSLRRANLLHWLQQAAMAERLFRKQTLLHASASSHLRL